MLDTLALFFLGGMSFFLRDLRNRPAAKRLVYFVFSALFMEPKALKKNYKFSSLNVCRIRGATNLMRNHMGKKEE